MAIFCYLSVTRTVCAFVAHSVMVYVRLETFITRTEFSVILKISLQGSTPRFHSKNTLYYSTP